MNDIDNTVNRAQKLSRRYMELVSKDIQENINSLYDGPFQTGSITQQRGQGGGAAQGTVYLDDFIMLIECTNIIKT